MAPPALKGAPLPNKPISTILCVIALQAEASPLVADLKLVQDKTPGFPSGLPWEKYSGNYEGVEIHVVTPGVDAIYGVNPVGTVPASMLTFASIVAFKPDLIINCGTAGGFLANGAAVADVFVVTESAFHDRRNPIPGYHEYGIGALEATPVSKLVEALNLKTGVLTTGDSLDHTPDDDAVMKANNASVKDMEGAAIAYVADMLSVPLIMFKGVTDIVDGPVATETEFLANLTLASRAVQQTVCGALQYLAGKTLSDLQ